jgi:flagellar biosynthesis/type III secretory pathway protein FliH
MHKVLKAIDVPEAVRPAFEKRPMLVRAQVWCDLGDLAAEVENTKNEALALLEDARVSASRIRENAFEEGLLEGGARFLEALVKNQADHAEWLERAEPEAVELALKIAERVVGELVRSNPAAMHAIIHKAASAARGRGDLEMSVHPESVVHLQQLVDALSREFGVSVRLLADERLNPADCIVHTSAGDIDARLETQMQAIRRVLLGKA